MNVELSGMTLAELKKLKSKVEKAIVGREQRRKKDARQAMEKVAKEFGLSVDDVLKGGGGATKAKPKKAGAKRKAAKPKFRNPKDASQTWSGRGRRPDWFNAAVAAGKSADDMAI